MKKLKTVQTDRAPEAIGPYSQAIVAGRWIFASGQIPVDPKTGDLVTGSIATQTECVMQNLAAVLDAAGASLKDVVKTTVFLASMDDFAAMNEVYGRHFGDHRPARATVQAGRLPKDVAVEIECVARRRG
jgi:2-iminobutanoate/2-iminopropanoate deaminase